jgi:single-stranded-DNA-specific exonuclease
VEQLFRTGELRCIVSTSAFGEGVNIPDIRQVALFHLPFNAVEFNQMSGRAGRDGSEAGIHLLYGKGDAQINSRILESNAPRREDLATLYRVLMAYARQQEEHAAGVGSDDNCFAVEHSALAAACVKTDPRCRLDSSAVAMGIATFAELGLVEWRGYPVARTLRVTKDAQRVELSQSSRYLEGCEELELFAQFRDWALGASGEDLLARINRPILPLGLG